MNLIKTSVLSAIATVIKTISGFIVTKVVAVYVGPSGLAIIGQLQSFINLVLLAAGNFLKTAITKFTAEYNGDESKKYGIWSASAKISLGLNVVIFFVLFLFSEQISNYLFKSAEYGYILKILSVSLPFFVLNTILLSILNGQKQINKYVILNILLSIVSLILVVILSVQYALDGALIAYVINQSVVFIITLLYLRREPWLKLKNFLYRVQADDVKKILSFAVITFTAIVASNASMIYLRNYIAETVSLEGAGYWQGIWTLSQISLTLITTSLATYFLPTLSELKCKEKISKELTNAIYVIIPVAVAISLLMYLLREMIIQILYTDEFMPMSELFLWQMAGNVLKVCGWLFGYVLVAKAMVKYTVTTEIIFALTFVVFTALFISSYGLVGVTYAYALNCLLHFITMYIIYKTKLFKGKYV